MSEQDLASGGTGAAAPRTEWVRGSIGPQLNRAARSARMLLEQRLAEAGASFGNWTVLAGLEAGGPMIQRELAARLSIEGPTLTRHLERLEERGLVRRERTGSDRRTSQVQLSETGRDLCHRLDALAREANAQLLQGLSKSDVTQLQSLLSRIHANSQTSAG